jgi:cystathionine beta-lyase
MDCWLALRGLKTMALRLERAASNAAKMADWLAAHPLVTRINYAGLEGTPGAELHRAQASSGGAVLSFTTGDVEVSKAIVEETKLFKVGGSIPGRCARFFLWRPARPPCACIRAAMRVP